MQNLVEAFRNTLKHTPEPIQLPPKPEAGPIVPATGVERELLQQFCELTLQQDQISQPDLQHFTKDIISLVGGYREVRDRLGGFDVLERSNPIPEFDKDNVFSLGSFRFYHPTERTSNWDYFTLTSQPVGVNSPEFHQTTNPVLELEISWDNRFEHPRIKRELLYPVAYTDVMLEDKIFDTTYTLREFFDVTPNDPVVYKDIMMMTGVFNRLLKASLGLTVVSQSF